MTHTTGTAADVSVARYEDLAATSLALARRFAVGGTLWCCAPGAAFHAHHVAVEFVHPVIVGKRALPAVAIDSAGDQVGELRTAAHAGDVLVAIAPGTDPTVTEMAQRCLAWGVETIWIGAGPRPPAGAADHVLWTEGDNVVVATEHLVRMYHLLWELTHVCFEHPGLLKAETCEPETVCVTCSDQGIVAEVESVDVDGDRARVRMPRGRDVIDTTLIDRPRPGDLVLVHAGSAIATLPALSDEPA